MLVPTLCAWERVAKKSILPSVHQAYRLTVLGVSPAAFLGKSQEKTYQRSGCPLHAFRLWQTISWDLPQLDVPVWAKEPRNSNPKRKRENCLKSFPRLRFELC